MTAPPDPDGDIFQGWLEDRLDTELGVQAAAPAPANALYRMPKRRRMATPLRVGLATGAAVLAIGGGAAYAAGLVPGTGVSQSAQSCPSGHDDSHGDCVATAAQTSSTGETTETAESSSSTRSNSDTHGDAVSNAAHTCPTSPPDAHGDCVSAIASAGHGTHTSTTTTTSTTGSANAGHGLSVSGEHTSTLPH